MRLLIPLILIFALFLIGAIYAARAYIAGIKVKARPDLETEHMVSLLERVVVVDEINAFIPIGLRDEISTALINHRRGRQWPGQADHSELEP